MVNDVLTAIAVDVRPAKGSQTAAPTLAAQVAASSGKEMPQSGEAVPAAALPPKAEIQLPDISRAVKNLNEFMQNSQRTLSFRIDEASGRTVITVVNPTTKEIVRQIPPEEVLMMARTLRDAGILFDALA